MLSHTIRVPLTVVGALCLAFLAGCTVKSAEAPPPAGPSSLAISITMTADKDILSQNGLDEAVITVQALGPNGESRNIALRVDILVAGVVQDFGTLSTKTLTTPGVIRYRAPAAPSTAGGQVAQVVTIAVTPIGGDNNGEVRRTIELRLVPPGVILPINPALVPAFTVTPTSPQAFATASFDASATTNSGVRCNTACTYNWNFGDGTTGAGMTTTHQFRTAGTFQVVLTVTDSRGSQATAIQTVTVTQSTPPTAAFRFSPTPVGTDQTVFFTAEESRPAAGRTIVRYDWRFGDGNTASGVAVTHSYRQNGSYVVVLTVTDDANASAQSTQTVTVSAAAGPTAALTFSPSAPSRNQAVFFNASGSTPGTAPIASYRFNYGDGTPDDVGPSATSSHAFAVAGTYTVRVTVTDTLGRAATSTVSVPVSP